VQERLGLEKNELVALRAQSVPVVGDAQVFVAQALADVSRQDDQRRQCGMAWADQLSAERRVWHTRQVCQQWQQRGSIRLRQIVQADVQQVPRYPDEALLHSDNGTIGP
jgi:hypothetical protein